MDRLEHLVAGTMAGIAECIVGQPMDTVRSRLQAKLLCIRSHPVSEWEAWTNSIRQDGIMQLYRGSSTRIIASAIGGATLYGLNNAIKKMFNVDAEEDGVTSIGFFIAAGGCGLGEAIIYTPLESIKLHMQMAAPSAKASLFQSTRQLYRIGKFSAFFRGFGATACREVPGNFVYFTTYQLLKNNISIATGRHPKDATYWTIFVSGGFAGVFLWLFCHPIDTLKSLIQTDNFHKPKYSGLIDCIRKVQKERGLLSLYRGLGLSLTRAFPCNAVAFSTYEFVVDLFPR